MIDKPVRKSEGKLARIASPTALTMTPAIWSNSGSLAIIPFMRFVNPSEMRFPPPSVLPEKISVNPLMTVVMLGKKSDNNCLPIPANAVFISCIWSWNAAEALTASSDITPPSS